LPHDEQEGFRSAARSLALPFGAVALALRGRIVLLARAVSRLSPCLIGPVGGLSAPTPTCHLLLDRRQPGAGGH
jgi:hypothetical protein